MEHLCQPLLRTIIMIAWIGQCAFPLKAQTLEGEITARDVLPPVAIDLFLNDDNQLLKSSITALATDNSGKLWIGTMGSGAKVLNTNTWHLVHIGETGDTVQGHGRAPHRHFSYEFGLHCEVQPFATATARTVQL